MPRDDFRVREFHILLASLYTTLGDHARRNAARHGLSPEQYETALRELWRALLGVFPHHDWPAIVGALMTVMLDDVPEDMIRRSLAKMQPLTSDKIYSNIQALLLQYGMFPVSFSGDDMLQYAERLAGKSSKILDGRFLHCCGKCAHSWLSAEETPRVCPRQRPDRWGERCGTIHWQTLHDDFWDNLDRRSRIIEQEQQGETDCPLVPLTPCDGRRP